MMNNNSTLAKDVQGALIGMALGQGLCAICSRGLSKEMKVKLQLAGLVRGGMVGVATIGANEICRRIFDEKNQKEEV